MKAFGIVCILLVLEASAGAKIRFPSRTGLHSPSPKRDVFLSRGWGAGGMPFSVLYSKTTLPEPHYHHQPAAQVAANPQSAPQPGSRPRPKASPHIRTSVGVRRPFPVIPQLFVSYGWGPLGK